MLSVPVYSESGQQVASEQIDEVLLGARVNPRLLKQVLVAYQANRRQGQAAQKSRGQVAGATRKLYRQKGTGRARMGSRRTPLRRGGGRAFPRRPREFRQALPRKMRRLARNQAVLAKIQSADALILDTPTFEQPQTKRFAALLQAVKCAGGCLLATAGVDPLLYKSGRNVPRTRIIDVAQLNAFDVLSRRRLLFTRQAFARFRDSVAAPAAAGAGC